jgi:hypothetical protein
VLRRALVNTLLGDLLSVSYFAATVLYISPVPILSIQRLALPILGYFWGLSMHVSSYILYDEGPGIESEVPII